LPALVACLALRQQGASGAAALAAGAEPTLRPTPLSLLRPRPLAGYTATSTTQLAVASRSIGLPTASYYAYTSLQNDTPAFDVAVSLPPGMLPSAVRASWPNCTRQDDFGAAAATYVAAWARFRCTGFAPGAMTNVTFTGSDGGAGQGLL
jgi:hypothetical protein